MLTRPQVEEWKTTKKAATAAFSPEIRNCSALMYESFFLGIALVQPTFVLKLHKNLISVHKKAA